MAISKVIYKEDENDSGTVWMDTTDKTVTAGDMLSGKTALKADGTTATGNIATKTSSDLTASGLTITAPAGYYASSASKSASDENLIASNIKKDVTIFSVTGTYEGSGGGAVEAEEKDVNFIDYDGTILYSYTASEFANLSALPANPSHTGLTAQGWNWSLSDAKTHVATYGELNIGQMYVTSSGDTEIDIELVAPRLSPYLGIAVNGTVDVDWGDNSTHSTVTGTSLSVQKRTLHTYSAAGAYTIKIKVTSGSYSLYGSSTYPILSANASSSSDNRIYALFIKSVRLGTGVNIVGPAFYYACNLQSISIPTNTTIGSQAFYYALSLKGIVFPTGTSIDTSALSYSCVKYVSLPKGVTSVGTGLFSNCMKLKRAPVFDGVSTIPNSTYYNCNYLIKIIVPSNITAIGTSAFSSCYGLAEFHFKGTTPPTVSNSNTFGSSIPTDCIIYVPYSADHSILNSYKSANNYLNPATYTYMEE